MLINDCKGNSIVGDKRLLFVTYQPANANSFVVVADIFRNFGFDIVIVAANGSRGVWNESGYKILNDSDELGYDDAVAILEDVAPVLLIAGTSMLESVEAKFIKAARTLNIKSVSFIDFWNKYRERFCLGKEVVFPHKVLVLDNVMREEIVKLGFPSDIIEIVGSPHLERIRQNSRCVIKKSNNDNCIKIGFFSQPIARMYGYDENSTMWFGYHEGTILRSLIECLDKISKKNMFGIEITVNLHPREFDGELLKGVIAECQNSSPNDLLSVKMDRRNSVEVINESDIVLGMTTIVLLESIVLDKPTLSVQINSNGRFKFVPTELQLIENVYNEQDLFLKLDHMCSQSSMRSTEELENPLRYLYCNATDKFCAACSQLL